MIDVDAVTQSVIDVLKSNDRGGYTIPTDGLYPYQWNWDSAITALGIAEFDLDRSWRELETLMSGQWDSGMVPQILFHTETAGNFPGPDVWKCQSSIPSSGISQPPIAVTAARLIWEKDKALGDARMAALLPKLRSWIDWFIMWRLDDKGAVFTRHPWEAGRDNAPDWDKSAARIDTSAVQTYKREDTNHVNSDHRPTQKDYDLYVWLLQIGRDANWDDSAIAGNTPFKVADPLMTFITLRAVRDLLALSEAFDQDATQLVEYVSVLEAGAESLWNPEIQAYDSRDVETREFAGSLSCGPYLCW